MLVRYEGPNRTPQIRGKLPEAEVREKAIHYALHYQRSQQFACCVCLQDTEMRKRSGWTGLILHSEWVLVSKGTRAFVYEVENLLRSRPSFREAFHWLLKANGIHQFVANVKDLVTLIQDVS